MEIEKKQVFISYSRYDYKDENKKIIPGNAVTEIKGVFDAANITYWIDEEGVYSGDQYVPIIAKAIKMCDVFLFISSKSSNSSEWTSSEIAAARMYKKKIIPLRLDDSPYHDSIILYIAHLDFLDYKKNPQLALTKLVDSVKEYLERIETEKKKQQEEIESKKRQKEKEQKKLIADIELQAEELENDERDAELKRRKLQQIVQNVESEEERNRLLELIESKGSIQRKFNEIFNNQKEKLSELEQQQKELKEEHHLCVEENESCKKELAKSQAELSHAKKQLKSLSGIATPKNSKLLIYILGASLVCSLVVIFMLLLFSNNEITEEQKMDIRTEVLDSIRGDSVRMANKNDSIMKSLNLRPTGGLYGYKDDDGVIRIPGQWEYVYEFKDNVAKVRRKVYRNSYDYDYKYGLIDKTGRVVVDCEYNNIDEFKDELAKVRNAENKYGFIDKEGNIIIECKWDYLEYFYEDRAAIRDSVKYGFIDKTDSVVIPCQYDKVWHFENGKAQVQVDNSIYYIDKRGNRVE